jgi:hypothetical protein
MSSRPWLSADLYYPTLDGLRRSRTGGTSQLVFSLKWAALLPQHDIAERFFGHYFHPRHQPPPVRQSEGPRNIHDQQGSQFYYRHRRVTVSDVSYHRRFFHRRMSEVANALNFGSPPPDSEQPHAHEWRPIESGLVSRYAILPAVPTELFYDLRAFALSPQFQNRHVLRRMALAHEAVGGKDRSPDRPNDHHPWFAEVKSAASQRLHAQAAASREQRTSDACPLDDYIADVGSVDELLAQGAIRVEATVDSVPHNTVTSIPLREVLGSRGSFAHFGRSRAASDRRTVLCANVTCSGMYPLAEYEGGAHAVPPWLQDGEIDRFRGLGSLPRHLHSMDSRLRCFADEKVPTGGVSLARMLQAGAGGSAVPVGCDDTVRQVWDRLGLFLDCDLVTTSQSQLEDHVRRVPYPFSFSEAEAPASGREVDNVVAPRPDVPVSLRVFGFDVTPHVSDVPSAKEAALLSDARERDLRAPPEKVAVFGRELCRACTLPDVGERNKLLARLAAGVEHLGPAFRRNFLIGAKFEFETRSALTVPILGVDVEFVTRTRWVVDRLTGDHVFLPVPCEIQALSRRPSATTRGNDGECCVTIHRAVAAFTDLLSSYTTFKNSSATAVSRLVAHRHALSAWSVTYAQNHAAKTSHRTMARDIRMDETPPPHHIDSTAYRAVWDKPRAQLGVATLSSAAMPVHAASHNFSWRGRPLDVQLRPVDILENRPHDYGSAKGFWFGYPDAPLAYATDRDPDRARWFQASRQQPFSVRPATHMRQGTVATYQLQEPLSPDAGITRSQEFLVFATLGLPPTKAGRVYFHTGPLGTRNLPSDFFSNTARFTHPVPGSHMQLVSARPVSFNTRDASTRGERHVLARHPELALFGLILDPEADARALWNLMDAHDTGSPGIRARRYHWPIVYGGRIVVVPAHALIGLTDPGLLYFPRTGGTFSQGVAIARSAKNDRIMVIAPQFWGGEPRSVPGRRQVLDEANPSPGSPVFEHGALVGFVGLGGEVVVWRDVYRSTTTLMHPPPRGA